MIDDLFFLFLLFYHADYFFFYILVVLQLFSSFLLMIAETCKTLSKLCGNIILIFLILLAQWLQCLLVVQEIGVQSWVELYQRLKNGTLSSIIQLTDKIKCSFFQVMVVSMLLYGCTTWTLAKSMEKKLDGNYTRILWAMLNKSWRQHPTKQQLYGHLPSIIKTIKVRQTRHAGHCWKSKDELISTICLWTPSHGWAKVGQPAGTYIQQLRAATWCSLEDLTGAMDDRDGWWERVREIHAGSMTWWWWPFTWYLVPFTQYLVPFT